MAAPKKAAQVRRRKELKKVDKGQAHIQSSFNNTLVTITDMNGNAISWSSAGSLGFKGSQEGHAVRGAVRGRHRRRASPKSTACVRSKCMSKAPARAEKRPSARSRRPISRSR